MYKVMSTCELLGLRAAMEEDEVERILGSDPVHMTEDGFVTLAENLIRTLDNPATLFAGEKRSREESVEGVVVGGWRRKTHEWLYSTVSGTGARRDNRVQQTRVTVPGQPAQPGTWEQCCQRVHQWRVHGCWRCKVA
jgi:hypothetical protein